MAASFFSPSWYRVAHLVPSLRAHVRFHRHVYRGQVWQVLEDPTTRRCHRLTPSAYLLAGLMDGARTVQEIWEVAGERLGDEAPSQDEVIRLLGLLYLADAVRCDVTPDTIEILKRCQRRERAEWWQRYTNPLSVRVSFGDPDAWLSRLVPVAARLLCGPVAVAVGLLWLAGALVALRHAPELSSGVSERVLAPGNLLLLALVYPVLKALHELGHALAVKVYGGEVRDFGVLFLVMMPVPYVDASAATAWPEKSRRIAVSAAGVIVECTLAAAAVLLWASVEPGLVRTLAFDVAWIGVASSLLVNGNPLMRFDGYYVLADAIEIPNLRQRGRQFLEWLVLARGFGVSSVRDPVRAPGEGAWLAAFAVGSFVYRIAIQLAIALFLSERFFFVGTLLAGFTVVSQLVLPLARGVRFLFESPRLGAQRPRALATCGGLVAAALLAAFVIPAPFHTLAQGVVWPPEGAHVRAATDGIVVELLATPGEQVERGQPLLRTREPTLETALAVEQARLRELLARHHAARSEDRFRARLTADGIEAARASVAHARERVGEVVVRAPASGEFVVPGATDLVGRFVSHGELLGYVVGEVTTLVRVVVDQGHAARLREEVLGAEVRPVVGEPRVYPARVRRELPGSAAQLPSAALGVAGGGPIPVDPDDPTGRTPAESVFQLDLELPPAVHAGGIGARVHVRFEHEAEPLGYRGIRSVQRVFLGRLGA